MFPSFIYSDCPQSKVNASRKRIRRDRYSLYRKLINIQSEFRVEKSRSAWWAAYRFQESIFSGTITDTCFIKFWSKYTAELYLHKIHFNILWDGENVQINGCWKHPGIGCVSTNVRYSRIKLLYQNIKNSQQQMIWDIWFWPFGVCYISIIWLLKGLLKCPKNRIF